VAALHRRHGARSVRIPSLFITRLLFGAGEAPAVIGYLLLWSGNNWNTGFYPSALVYAAGALCWVFIHPVNRLIKSTLTL
jgi:hypothetical protein